LLESLRILSNNNRGDEKVQFRILEQWGKEIAEPFPGSFAPGKLLPHLSGELRAGLPFVGLEHVGELGSCLPVEDEAVHFVVGS
jgi:hypothetical protein